MSLLDDDLKMGLSADVSATEERVWIAIERASAELGKRGILSREEGQGTVTINGGMVQATYPPSPLVGINVDLGKRGTSVVVGIVSYREFQAKIFGLIPMGPKMLAGRDVYRTFLETLHQELQALDGAAVIERNQEI